MHPGLCACANPRSLSCVQLVGYFALQQLLVQPWLTAQESRAKAERRRRNRALVTRRQQEAKAAVTLMKETVERKVGLIRAGLQWHHCIS